jgi:hypothetical protein
VRYAGTLPETHFRGVARLALAAEGFSASDRDLNREARALRAAGAAALADLRSESSGIRAALDELAGDGDPLPLAMPLLLGLGVRQAEVYKSIARTFNGDGSSALLSGTFNAAIVVYDQIIDQPARQHDLPSVVRAETVAGIFREPEGGIPLMEEAARMQADARTRLFLFLMSECARRGIALTLRYGTEREWQCLGANVQRLFSAESALNGEPFDQREHSRALAAAKSTLPSLVILDICHLADECRLGKCEASAVRLGRLFSAIDDLADLVSDLDDGRPNTLAFELAERHEGRTSLADADLYRACAEQAARVVVLLRSLEGDETRRFGEAIVASWLNWPPTDHPAKPESAHCAPLAVAVEALLRWQRDQYSEAIHWLRLPRLDWRFEVHPAIVAQRAVILDALLDARDAGVDVPVPVIADDTLRILEMKHQSVRGGWSYIASVPELPPDADDLGQILQVLTRVGGSELALTCDEGIRLLLDAAQPRGRIGTWLIDPLGQSAADERVLQYLAVMGGWGVHPEVVANFGYGLWLYDRERFADSLEGIADYLSTVQHADGSWTSRWYSGPFYGTYKALALLSAVRRRTGPITLARRFLRDTQRPGGAWGQTQAEALSTALAVLALLQVGAADDTGSIAAGVRALEAMQRDGVADACPWITFPTLDGIEVYGSAPITTAFTVKALAGYVRHLRGQTVREPLRSKPN